MPGPSPAGAIPSGPFRRGGPLIAAELNAALEDARRGRLLQAGPAAAFGAEPVVVVAVSSTQPALAETLEITVRPVRGGLDEDVPHHRILGRGLGPGWMVRPPVVYRPDLPEDQWALARGIAWRFPDEPGPDGEPRARALYDLAGYRFASRARCT